MKINKKNIISLLIVIAIPTLLFAQGMPPPASSPTITLGTTISNPFNGGNDLLTLIRDILSKIVMPIAAVLVVMWIVWAGFQFVIAQGKPGDIEKAKQNLLWSLIGAGILLGAAAISAVVETTVRALMS